MDPFQAQAQGQAAQGGAGMPQQQAYTPASPLGLAPASPTFPNVGGAAAFPARERTLSGNGMQRGRVASGGAIIQRPHSPRVHPFQRSGSSASNFGRHRSDSNQSRDSLGGDDPLQRGRAQTLGAPPGAAFLSPPQADYMNRGRMNTMPAQPCGSNVLAFNYTSLPRSGSLGSSPMGAFANGASPQHNMGASPGAAATQTLVSPSVGEDLANLFKVLDFGSGIRTAVPMRSRQLPQSFFTGQPNSRASSPAHAMQQPQFASAGTSPMAGMGLSPQTLSFGLGGQQAPLGFAPRMAAAKQQAPGADMAAASGVNALMGNLHVGAGGGVAAAGMVAEPAAYTEAKRNLAAAGGAGQRLPSLSGDLDLLGADLDLPEMDDVLDGELALIGLGGDDGGLTFDDGNDDLSLDLLGM